MKSLRMAGHGAGVWEHHNTITRTHRLGNLQEPTPQNRFANSSRADAAAGCAASYAGIPAPSTGTVPRALFLGTVPRWVRTEDAAGARRRRHAVRRWLSLWLERSEAGILASNAMPPPMTVLSSWTFAACDIGAMSTGSGHVARPLARIRSRRPVNVSVGRASVMTDDRGDVLIGCPRAIPRVPQSA
jgi:hypothetical protein